MRVLPQLFRCQSCGHEWLGELLDECPVALATQVMKTIRCPQGHTNRYVLLLYGDEAEAARQRLADVLTTD